MDMIDIPEPCKEGDHDFGQGGRCKGCNVDRAKVNGAMDYRKTGGAGVSRHPLTDEEYKEQMRKLERRK